MIDWMMDLPTDIALQFENELLTFEREKQMPYITSIERHGIERGIEQGIERGIEQGIEQGIERGELVGQIRVYQRLSGQQEQPREQLISQTVEALQTQLIQLQQSFDSSDKN